MVTVTGFKVHQGQDGEPFISLTLQGELEMIQGLESNNFYAHRRKCSVYSTLDEDAAKDLVGKQIKGSIIKQDVEPYAYTLPGTDDEITLAYTWVYSPHEPSQVLEQLAFEESQRKEILQEFA